MVDQTRKNVWIQFFNKKTIFLTLKERHQNQQNKSDFKKKECKAFLICNIFFGSLIWKRWVMYGQVRVEKKRVELFDIIHYLSELRIYIVKNLYEKEEQNMRIVKGHSIIRYQFVNIMFVKNSFLLY